MVSLAAVLCETLCNLGSVAQIDPTQDQSGEEQYSLNFTDSIAFEESARPIADVLIIYSTSTEFSEDSLPAFSALEFVLEWCVQKFTTTVTKRVSST